MSRSERSKVSLVPHRGRVQTVSDNSAGRHTREDTRTSFHIDIFDGIDGGVLFVATDEHAHNVFTAKHVDSTARSAIRFLYDAIAHFEARRVTATRLITDSSGVFSSRDFAEALNGLGIRQECRRSDRPHGKVVAERYHQRKRQNTDES